MFYGLATFAHGQIWAIMLMPTVASRHFQPSVLTEPFKTSIAHTSILECASRMNYRRGRGRFNKAYGSGTISIKKKLIRNFSFSQIFEAVEVTSESWGKRMDEREALQTQISRDNVS